MGSHKFQNYNSNWGHFIQNNVIDFNIFYFYFLNNIDSTED